MIILVEKTLIIFAKAVIISIIYNLHYKSLTLNFHIKKPHEFRKFWMATSGPFFNFCKGFVTSLKMYSFSRIKRDVYKIIIMAFNEIKHFVAFYQPVILTLKETKYKKLKHTSLVLH